MLCLSLSTSFVHRICRKTLDKSSSLQATQKSQDGRELLHSLHSSIAKRQQATAAVAAQCTSLFLVMANLRALHDDIKTLILC